jgi:hypothetical protein
MAARHRNLSVLYNFCAGSSLECPDGAYPYSITKDAE